MELTLVEDEKKIERYHKELGRIIRSHSAKSAKQMYIGTRGGGGTTSIFHNPQNNFWWSNFWGTDSSRFYNIFGLDPNYEGTNYILVQINYQKEFKSFSTGALWAEDKVGEPYLLHSGKMGGGVAGFTMENIDKLYAGSRSVLIAHGKEYEYYTVCKLHSSRAYQQIIAFVRQIEDIKNIIKDESNLNGTKSNTSDFTWKKYTPEFWGKRKTYFTKRKLEPEVDHGYLVDCLQKELENNGFKGKIHKNKWVDLGIVNDNMALSIFEIKTSVNMQSLYTAVGQLLLHSQASRSNPKKIVVLPDELNLTIENDLSELNIATLRYKWKNSAPVFLNLNKVILR